jgi:hypothetical protein
MSQKKEARELKARGVFMQLPAVQVYQPTAKMYENTVSLCYCANCGSMRSDFEELLKLRKKKGNSGENFDGFHAKKIF